MGLLVVHRSASADLIMASRELIALAKDVLLTLIKAAVRLRPLTRWSRNRNNDNPTRVWK